MLSSLVAKNFKSIGEKGVDISLKPLTFLVGQNGTGKSSILQAIALAAQRGQRSGQLVSFLDLSAMLHKRVPETTLTIQVGFAEEIAQSKISMPNVRITIRGGSFNFDWFVGDEPVTDTNKQQQLEKTWGPFFGQTYYLSSERGVVPDIAPDAAVQWVGKRGEHLLPWLNKLNSNEYGRQWKSIAEWSERFGAGSPRGKPSGSPGWVSADFRDPVLDSAFDLSQASFGARQMLVFLVQLFISPKGSLLLLEEPETSLHPASQVEACQILAEGVKRGIQVITSTHSSFLLLGLPSAVQRGLVKSQDIAVYEISKNEKGTSAKQLKIDREGYIPGWVPTFGAVERTLLRQWTKHLPRD